METETKACAAFAIAALLVWPGAAAPAQPVALVPRPAKMQLREGHFPVSGQTRIAVTAETEHTGTMLARWLAAGTGLAPRVERAPASADHTNAIVLRLVPKADAAYTLRVLPDRVEIESASQTGLVYGCQSLRQLLSRGGEHTWTLPFVEIEDSPRFAWRGLMLDCSRTFLNTAYLKRTIELLSYHKLNVLHLHLTDDQGWRIQINKRPRLTTVGSRFAARYAGERGGSYSQQEIRELVRFAADRGVMLVPEIEMPGHATAALAAYPELSCNGGPFEIYPFFKGPNITKDVFCAGNEGTFELLEDVLSEVSDLFPGPYIHIGGDECPKDRWKTCPKCQARMRAEGLKDEAALQAYFVKRIARFLETRNKRVVGWDEITEGGLPRSAAVMFWRGLDGAASLAGAGHDVILSPTSCCYLDYRQSDLPQERAEGTPITLDRIYSFDPVPPGSGTEVAQHVLGAQANMWTHYARTEDEIDRQIFPRLAALAEGAWTPQALRRWADFRDRMRVHCRRLSEMGVRMGINFNSDPSVWADPARGAGQHVNE